MHVQRVPHKAPVVAGLIVRGRLCLAINVFWTKKKQNKISFITLVLGHILLEDKKQSVRVDSYLSL